MSEEIIKQFGFDPKTVGVRHRGFWIITEIEEEEERAGAKLGDLCIKSRDNGIDVIDDNAFSKSNYRGTATDGFDKTYRYYYFKPLEVKQ